MIIKVEGLGKRYRLRHGGAMARDEYATLRDTIANAGRSLMRGLWSGGMRTEEYWALRDISFEVPKGEVLGVIGRNGAGKSTLLKVLSRITDPTEGRFRIRGRVGSLLEVGAGFHPELSGRENIFLNAALLGMTRAEARARFDDIVAFAEVEQFLDTPVKRYSSGMYVRLAFSVAAHLEPEVLLVDEVLAVGDAVFQERCLGKIKSVAGHGRTVLFVSHNMASITGLCTQGLVLDKGRIAYHGDVKDAVAHYLRKASEGRFEAVAGRHSSLAYAEVDPEALARGALRVKVGINSETPIRPNVGLVVSGAGGAPIFGTDLKTNPPAQPLARMTKGELVMEIGSLPFHSGRYLVSIWLTDLDTGPLEQLPDALAFEFVSPVFIPDLPSTTVIGPLRVDARWQVEVG